MKNAKNNFVFLLIFILCVSCVSPQQSQPYPADADDVITSVAVFSRKDFSVADAVKLLGTIDDKNHDATHWSFQLIPLPSERERVESIRIDTYDERRKLDSVEIKYVKPVLISYGKLRQKYGEPRSTRLPRVMCLPGNDNCAPAFIGYDFDFAPDPKNTDLDKKLGVFITLYMEWSKTIPNHTDKDFLEVKSIRFKRNVYDED